jgi:hypothetical protein
MNSRTRSPNYPSMSLGEAIEAIRKVYSHEKRGRFPRLSLATHLGYTSINGRSLAKIGTLRAYGLIDGREDTLTVSQTALAIIEAPEGSEDRARAYKEAFLSPGIFARIFEEYGDTKPSPHTLRWWLQKQNYIGDAADKAMQSYLESFDLVNSIEGTSSSTPMTEDEPVLIATRPLGPSPSAARQVQTYSSATNAADSRYQPDFKISLGGGRWLLIELKGGEPTARDFVKLEKFARFQRELLEDEDEWAAPDDEDRDPRD